MHNELTHLTSINQRVLKEKEQSGFRVDSVKCIANTGQEISFLAPEMIEIALIKLFERVNKTKDLINSMAICWIGLISIHPFSNGNGRTAKEYLKLMASNKDIQFNNLYQIDSILLTEQTNKNISEIENFLNQNIKLKESV